jgi:predicted homoserine dehydrogenase-like protein
MGLADGCKLLRDIPKDAAITFDDVEIPANRLCNKLWLEQKELFKI